MKTNHFPKTYQTILLALLFTCFITSCSKDDETSIEKPTINLKELGSGHDSPDDKTAYMGSDIHIEAEIVAKAYIKQIEVKIKQMEGDFELSKMYTDEQYVGKLNTSFHEHIDIPGDFAAGAYEFYLIVSDQNGQTTEAKSSLMLKDYGSDAPEPTVSEFEGVKLVVTYKNNNIIDLREPFSDRNDVLEASSPNAKISKSLRFFTANAVLYSDSYIDFVFTGLDPHGNHFHTYDPAVQISAQANSPSEPYWRAFLASSFQKDSGDIIYTRAEAVLEGLSEDRIEDASRPHNGKAAALDNRYFAVTDATEDGGEPSIIKVIKTDKTLVKTFTGYNKITDFATFRVNYIDQIVFATDKNLLMLNLGYSTDYNLVDDTIPNPTSFDGEPFDKLHNVKDYSRTSVLGIKNDQGIYNIDFVSKQIDQVLSSDNIASVTFDFEEKFCYILSTGGQLAQYNMNDFSKMGEVSFAVTGDELPSIVASRKFVYVAYEGDTSIKRFGVEDFVQYRSIEVDEPISDIGLAGNLEEMEINNHLDEGR